MDPLQFLSSTRLIIVAGKGGVGKTTVAATLAHLAASLGRSTLLVEVEGKGGLAELFGVPPITYDPSQLMEGIDARLITPDQALVEWLQDKGLRRLADRLVKTGALDVIATAAPGIRDILVLGRVKALVNEAAHDLIVLDTPASGHAISFLQSARGLEDAVNVGAINQQARDVIGLLTDPRLCQVVLVTMAEATPVNELVETAYALEDRVGVALGPVVVNRVLSPLASDLAPVDVAALAGKSRPKLNAADAARVAQALEFRLASETSQRSEQARLAVALPLPQVVLPALAAHALDIDDIAVLSAALAAGLTAMPAS